MAAIVANCAISLNCELTQPVKVQYIDGNMFSMDNAGNTAHVYVFYNGEPQEIVGSVTADVIRSDGTTVAITGAMSGNRAYVIFPQSCYAVPGVISVVIKVTEGTTVTTIAAFVANVYRSSTDTIVDPGTIIPSVQNLISAIETAVASIPADYSSLWESLAQDYTNITFPVTAGKYCTYNGTLYIAKVDIATTESFTAAHWQSTNIGDNLSALKSAMGDQRQKYNVFPQKNYFSQAERGNPCTINSRTYNIQPNGEILVTGQTSTKNSTYYISGTGEQAGWDGFTVPAGTYRFYTKEDISSYASVRVRFAGDSSWQFDFSASGTIRTFDADTPITIGLYVANNKTLPADGIIVQPMIVNVNNDYGYIAPWASWANYVPQILKDVHDNTEDIEALDNKTDESNTQINYIIDHTLVESLYDTEYVSGGLNNSWVVTSNNSRIRTKGTEMPSMKAGDRIVIDSAYEARVIASVRPGYSYDVVGVITGDDWVNGTVVIPEEYNGKYIGLLIRKVGHIEDDISGDVATLTNYIKMYNVETVGQNTERNVLSGLNISILGDSISAMKNYIPAGNEHYYSGSNHGVTSVNQMWWKILADSTGANPLIMNAWSGSGVTQLEDSSHVNKVPMSADSRCYALHAYIQTDQGEKGAIEVTAENIDSIVTSPFFPAYTPAIGDYVKKIDPDIVIIAGGVNDYTYAQSAQSEALPWNGKTTPVLGDSFTEAYACMIKKIQYAYPSAIIVALSTWFTMRGEDNGYTLTHTVGSNVYTQTDYNDAIRGVAEQMHIPYMDVSNIGFNRNNFYPTYASDSSTIPTHPNAEGQYVMGRAISRKIIPLVKAFKER